MLGYCVLCTSMERRLSIVSCLLNHYSGEKNVASEFLKAEISESQMAMEGALACKLAVLPMPMLGADTSSSGGGPPSSSIYRAKAKIGPCCGSSSVELFTGGSGGGEEKVAASCSKRMVHGFLARGAAALPSCGPPSLIPTRAGTNVLANCPGLYSMKFSKGGGGRRQNMAPLSAKEVIIHSYAILGSRAGEQRRRRCRRYSALDDNSTVVRSVGNGILKREESGGSLVSLANRAVQLTIKLVELAVAGRVLKRALNRALRKLEGSGGGVSLPILRFAGFGACGDNCAKYPKCDERRLCHQWFPSVKRRGLMFFVSSAMIAMLAVGGPTNYALQPAWSLTEENLVFLEAWRIVDRAYVDKSFNGQSWFRYREDALRREPMKTREQTYDAIRKMLATLDDPFTRFLEPEKFKALKSGTNGALIGVGLEVGFDVSMGGTSEDLVVVSPVLGGPAGRAGIVPGDLILAIDGVSTKGMGLYDAARRLQGPLNSPVDLTVLNKSFAMPKTVTVLREKVTLSPVSWKLCDMSKSDHGPTKLGYIRLSTFNQNSTRDMKAAIKSLRESGATSFVLDIRNNSGGLFPAGIEIAKMWLDKGVIVYITDSMGVRDIYETDGEGAIATREPLAVLVNKGTASASEILAGALKDNNRALIVGETTFGKGRIQSIFQLSDGSGMAVTVARYETPAHVNIDKVGITPDHPISSRVLPMEEEGFCSFLQDPLSSSDIRKLFST